MNIVNNISLIVEELEFNALNLDILPEDEYLLEGDNLDVNLLENLSEAGFSNFPITEIAISGTTKKVAGFYATQAGLAGVIRAGVASHTTTGFGLAVGAYVGMSALAIAAGAYVIYRYINSISRLNRVINKLKENIAVEDDPNKKTEYINKLEYYTKKLEVSKEKARISQASYIKETKILKYRLEEMKKNKADPESIAKLQKKLDARMKFMSKIGAIV